MLHFPGQREDEDILAFISKHWIVYSRIIFLFLGTTVLPLVFFLSIWFFIYPIDAFYERSLVVGIFTCLYVLIGLFIACMNWINEEFDVFILTTDRLIDVTQVTLFNRTVTSTPLQQIQDTTGKMKGFFPSLLSYGDLEVQTAAGDASDFFIDSISNPEAVARQILDLADRKRDERHYTRKELKTFFHNAVPASVKIKQ